MSQSLVNWESTLFTEYLVYVHGFGGATGDYVLEITGASLEEGCNAARSLPIGATYRGSTAVEKVYPVPRCGVAIDVSSKVSWFTMTGTGARVIIYTCFNTAFDTMVSPAEFTCC